MEMYLARAMMAAENKRWPEVEKSINAIDTACLHEQARKLYKNVVDEYKKGVGK